MRQSVLYLAGVCRARVDEYRVTSAASTLTLIPVYGRAHVSATSMSVSSNTAADSARTGERPPSCPSLPQLTRRSLPRQSSPRSSRPTGTPTTTAMPRSPRQRADKAAPTSPRRCPSSTLASTTSIDGCVQRCARALRYPGR
jgi:hypothetical protein